VTSSDNLLRLLQGFVKSNEINYLNQNLVLQAVALGIIHLLSFNDTIFRNSHSSFKSLIYTVNQSFLLIMKLVLAKITPTSLGNFWINSIKNIISKKLKNSQENILGLLNKNSQILSNQTHNIISINKASIPIFEEINYIINNSSKQNLQLVRNLFYSNIFKNTIRSEDGPFLKNFPIILDEANRQVINYPFLPKLDDLKKNIYTLILDLDETLIHFDENENTSTLHIRPGTEEFLKEAHAYYEIAIFTAAAQEVL